MSTLTGTGSTGYIDGTGTSAYFSSPWGIDIDQNTKKGTIYVTDYGNRKVWKISLTG